MGVMQMAEPLSTLLNCYAWNEGKKLQYCGRRQGQ